VSIFRQIFPESLFPRRLDEGAERRLRLAQAKAEDALIEAHVRNTLMFIDTLAEDMPFDRAVDTYVRALAVPEPLASIVATRALVELGEDLVPRRVLRPRPDRRRRDEFNDELPTDEHSAHPTIRIERSEAESAPVAAEGTAVMPSRMATPSAAVPAAVVPTPSAIRPVAALPTPPAHVPPKEAQQNPAIAPDDDTDAGPPTIRMGRFGKVDSDRFR
jgi:hypothetical protein